MNERWTIEDSPLGGIVVPPSVPEGFGLFYTSGDFPGALDETIVDRIQTLIEQRFGLRTKLATCGQIHSSSARRVERPEEEWCEMEGCDALWSSEPSVSLGIKVADCLPVTVIDPVHRVTANIHAGWRGSAGGIVAATLESISRESSFQARDAVAYLGPSIRSCCFEVGEEVIEAFRPGFPEIERHTDRTRGVRPYLDVVSLTSAILVSCGLPPGSIHDSRACTRCEGERFHSYRRDRGRNGRNLAITAQ